MNLPKPKRIGKKIKVEHTALGYLKTEWLYLCVIEGTDFLWMDSEGNWLNTPTPNPEMATDEMFTTHEGLKVIDTKA